MGLKSEVITDRYGKKYLVKFTSKDKKITAKIYQDNLYVASFFGKTKFEVIQLIKENINILIYD